MAKLLISNLGTIGYNAAWDAQREAHARVLAGGSHELIFCQHPHVYTLGSQTKLEHLLMDDAGYRAIGAELVKTDRGGDVTYHGPGQLVGYPILDLARLSCGQDLHKFLRGIEEALIQVLAHYGLQAQRNPGKTGVWVGGEKIAAIGFKCKRWVSMHGFALNVSPDLSYFSKIIPCGLTEPVTSMAALLGDALPAWQELETACTDALISEFKPQ